MIFFLLLNFFVGFCRCKAFGVFVDDYGVGNWTSQLLYVYYIWISIKILNNLEKFIWIQVEIFWKYLVNFLIFSNIFLLKNYVFKNPCWNQDQNLEYYFEKLLPNKQGQFFITIQRSEKWKRLLKSLRNPFERWTTINRID